MVHVQKYKTAAHNDYVHTFNVNAYVKGYLKKLLEYLMKQERFFFPSSNLLLLEKHLFPDIFF